ncbi:hypothetical protein QZH56_22685 [Streptomyces olivoreticuli]|uniref:hypothetical protein n=1 Tax=Streptomyces olivoreticuli TaxID=68246 RepID=UPI0026587422|nr:hypothetical protein [Streptomyces olivoreticuli]WKK21649.1 hypothetical protein QZH56_22685 [Streptomyces olivoreticuli]
METTQPTAGPAASNGASRRVVVRRWAIGLVSLALIGWGAVSVHDFYQDMAGGPIHTADEYLKRDVRTRQAGKREVGQLGAEVGDPESFSPILSTSCVDEIGFDRNGVTRHQPIYEWPLSLSGRAAYLTQLKELRTVWESRGWKVRDTVTQEFGPNEGLSGIKTTNPDGIAITLAPNPHSVGIRLTTDGGCIRHRSVPEHRS